jgi:hypothetical protein
MIGTFWLFVSFGSGVLFGYILGYWYYEYKLGKAMDAMEKSGRKVVKIAVLRKKQAKKD